MKLRISLLIICTSWMMGLCWAQNSTPNDNSPFSIYGLGNFLDQSFVFNGNMGGLSAALQSPYHWNVENPASLASLRSVSFQAGAYIERSSLTTTGDDPQTTVWNGNLRYLALGMPLRNTINVLEERKERDYSIGLGVSLMPYTRAAQSVRITTVDSTLGSVEQDIERQGGTQKVRAGIGAQYKDFSAGVGAGFLFGRLEKNQILLLPDQSGSSQVVSEVDTRITGFVLDYGAMYSMDLPDKKRRNSRSGNERTYDRDLVFGINGSLGNDFNTTTNSYDRVLHRVGRVDTVLYQEDVKNDGTLGTDLSFGITYMEGRRWIVGAQYTLGRWSEYRNEADPQTLEDSWEFALGATWRPDPQDVLTYGNRVGYQLGLQIGRDPRVDAGEQIRYLTARAGVELPVVYSRQVSHLSLGIEYGRIEGGFVTDNYFRFSVGMTFNDNNWFLKRKYD